LFLLLAGCAAGPNYQMPKTDVPAAFAGAAQTNLSTNETAVTWWRGFNDAQLNQLIERAIASNYDLRIATANVLEARALHRSAQFDLLPVPGAEAGYTHELFSQAFEPTIPRNLRELELYDAGFDATWELDFFGRLRRSNEAASAAEQAAMAARRDVMVTLISEVARNYFELLGAEEELAVARQNADNAQETLRITQAIFEGGRGTQLDVDRANAQLNNTLANIPPLEAAISRARHRLSVLTGRQPTALDAELAASKPAISLPELAGVNLAGQPAETTNTPQTSQLIALPPMINIGNPEALLRRRPDIREAERSLAAATARIGIATADLFPRVTFNGNIGLEAASFSGLGKPGSDTWSFGPSITWALLDYGHVRARMKAAHAEADAALDAYQGTVLTALEETENALVDFCREQARREYLRKSERASASAARLARQRYEEGATDFLTALDAERVLFDAQDQLAQSNTRTFTALVAVYKSLGGGWEVEREQQQTKWPSSN